MDARFPRNALISRIEAIATKAAAISVTNLDAEVLMAKMVDSQTGNVLMYCDPPYYGMHSRLYLHRYTKGDHERIARFIQKVETVKWVVSYDNSEAIRKVYSMRRLFDYNLQYSTFRSYLGRELMIFSDTMSLPNNSMILQINTALEKRLTLQEIGNS